VFCLSLVLGLGFLVGICWILHSLQVSIHKNGFPLYGIVITG
jgi:hypothetical protein